MGVADDLAALDGLTPAMLVRLGENDIKSLEDFAGCVTDDLTGWFETVERRRVRARGGVPPSQTNRSNHRSHNQQNLPMI